MKTELKLWKQYCQEIEKYNDKEQKRVGKVNAQIIKEHNMQRELMEKEYKKEYSAWEKKHKYYIAKIEAWHNLPFWKKIFMIKPQVPLRYSHELYAPRDYSWASGLPGYCLAFTKKPTYEGFLSWQIDKKI